MRYKVSGSGETELDDPTIAGDVWQYRLTPGRIAAYNAAVRDVLTPKQYAAMVAASRGYPLATVADQLGTKLPALNGLLRKALARLTPLGLHRPIVIQALRLGFDIPNGIRCRVCHLLLPCREDAQAGPCDSMENPDKKREQVLALAEAMLENNGQIDPDSADEAQRERYRASRAAEGVTVQPRTRLRIAA